MRRADTISFVVKAGFSIYDLGLLKKILSLFEQRIIRIDQKQADFI